MTEPRNTPRGRMTKARRLRAFERHSGVCVICQLKIDGVREKWIVEHITPLSMGGADDDENTAPAHERCARDKTAAEAPVRAKTLRIRTKHIGAVQKRPWHPTLRRKMNGTVVPREKGTTHD